MASDGPIGSSAQSEERGSRFLTHLVQAIGLGLVICILMLLLFPKGLFPSLKVRASQLYTCERNLDDLAVALHSYARDHRGNYPRTLGKLLPTYIGYIPHCRAVDRDTYSSGYQSSGDGFTVCCRGQNHSSSDWPAIASKRKFDKH